jgi:hypothetical protein
VSRLIKKLGILPIPCLYVLSLMIFVVNNFDNFQRKNTVHMLNTKLNDILHVPITQLSPYQRGVYYSSVKLFNILPKQISALKNNNQFRIALRSNFWVTPFTLLRNLLNMRENKDRAWIITL